MSAMDKKSEALVEKLSDRNYRTWKNEMKWFLRGKGLLDYALRTVEIGENASAADRKVHQTNDDKTMAAIGLSLEVDQQIHIEDCKTAHEAWRALEQIHEPKSRVRIMQLKKAFHHLQMKNDEHMSSYVARAKVAAVNLRDAGAEVRDEDLAYAILAGLPDSYENLNMALASLPDDKFTSTEIKRVLLAEYDRRQSRLNDKVDMPKEALVANKKIEDKKGKTTGNDKNKLITCYNCRKTGHLARDCRAKKDGNYRRSSVKQKRDYDAFLMFLNNVEIKDSWILDSGCTHHVCRRRDWFTNFREMDSEVINTAADPSKQNGATLRAKGIGDIFLKTSVANVERGIVLRDVYYVPNVRKNLMSVSQIERKGKELLIKDGKVRIRNAKTKGVICEAYRQNDLYMLKVEIDKNVPENAVKEINTLKVDNAELWHRRFCHVNDNTIRKLADTNRVIGLDNARMDNFTCEACCISKATKNACKRLKSRQSKGICELIHSDLCGPMPVKSIGESRYFLTFTDDFSRSVTVMCIKSKEEVKDRVREYITRIERESDKRVKRFRTDNGLEFCNRELSTFFGSVGIKHERSNVETPQMNGVAERINRTLLDLTRSMLKSAQLPQKFWAEAVTTAAYIRNRVCHSSIEDQVPFTVWTGRTPSVRHLKVYGCLAYARLPDQGRRKLDDRAVECIFIGYANQTKGYRLWCPQKGDVITTKHVRFAEDKTGYEWIYRRAAREFKHNDVWIDDDESTEENEPVLEPRTKKEKGTTEKFEETEDASENEGIVGVQDRDRKPKRGRKKKVIRNPYGRKGKPKEIQDNQEEESATEQSDIEANLIEIADPQDIHEALSSPQTKQWQRAIKEELDSLVRRKTWENTILPEGKRCIGCKWVFKTKIDADGKISRYKARLVAQGFTQEKGIDYDETYSPVINFSVIRLLLALSTEYQWHTRHIDVKNAYLYGNLHEEVYMKLPPLYNAKEGEVARLLRPIYGLKQSGRKWNEELNEFLIEIGFERLKSSNCTYRKGCWLIIMIYVDDIFIFSKKLDSITKTVSTIAKKYEIKDLGEIRYVMGVKLNQEQLDTVHLTQKPYIESILRKYNMQECKPASTPLEPGTKMSKKDSPTTHEEKTEMSHVPYRELIGSLMYLSQHTRPDIAFATSKLSQYNSNPGRVHWQQAKHVLRYLSKTKDLGIVYRAGGEQRIQVYCDADWAGDEDDRHSYSGIVLRIGENLIHWRATKQSCLSTSTMEAEYIALSSGVKEIVWLNMFLTELNLSDCVAGYQMFCDNRAAIDFSKNRVERNRTRHIDISYHVVREKVEEGLVDLQYVPSSENPADVMTKGLKRVAHNRCIVKMNMDIAKWGIEG